MPIALWQRKFSGSMPDTEKKRLAIGLIERYTTHWLVLRQSVMPPRHQSIMNNGIGAIEWLQKKAVWARAWTQFLPENDTEDRNAAIALKTSEIEPNREQPRKDFDEKLCLSWRIPSHSTVCCSRCWSAADGGWLPDCSRRAALACRPNGRRHRGTGGDSGADGQRGHGAGPH